MGLSRRDFCAGVAAAGAASLLGGCADGASDEGVARALGFGDGGKSDAFSDARYLGSLDVCELGFAAELVDDQKAHVKHSKGHNTRLYTDLLAMIPAGRFRLNEVGSDQLVVPQANYYIRTEAPNQLHTATDADIPSFDSLDRPGSPFLGALYDSWRVRVGGLVSTEARLWPALIDREVSDLGTTMMECAGNDRYSNYRLMSAARWRGIMFADFLQVLQARSGFGMTEVSPDATHVKISGFDTTTETRWNRFIAVESKPGASWIFSIQELIEQGAFFATGMQGQVLTLDHGFPLRLVVPRYYGCTCIKWVNEITFMSVDRTTPTTAQMQEFADRTHQPAYPRGPKLLHEHRPPIIDQAMLPATVEKWVVDGQLAYRVVGLMWGGTELRPDLALQTYRDGFWSNGPEIELAVDYQPQRHSDAFTLWWSEFWQPGRKGKYVLTPMIYDQHVQARRVRDGYYSRGVRIRERA